MVRAVGVPALRQGGRQSLGDARRTCACPNIEDGVQQKAWICGPSDKFVDYLHELENKYPGLEHIILHWAEGMPRDEFMEQLRRFAKEVMPAFQGR